MPIICQPAKMVFFPIPKVACTSLKVMFYEANNNVQWNSARLGFGQVHTLAGFGSLPFGATDLSEFDDYAKVAVVRNPINRALSAYRDKARRLVLEGTRAEEQLNKAGLPLEPSPELFFDEIDQYFECAPVIREHMRPYRYFLGDNTSYFKQIFRLEALDEFGAFFGKSLGKPVEMKSSNSSKKSVNAEKPISDATYKKIVGFCSDDLEYLSDYYDI